MFCPMAMALIHYPVLDRQGKVVTSAVTNLDVHDLARLATTYGLNRYYIVTPALEQQQLTARIVDHWQKGNGALYNPDRSQALNCLQITASLEDALDDWRTQSGPVSNVFLTGANFHKGIQSEQARILAQQKPTMLVFGTGHGLSPELLSLSHTCLAPVRPGGYNHLSVRTAAAIVLDRLVGDHGIISPLHSEDI